MANIYTNFSEYAIGETPADWTQRWVTGLGLSIVEDVNNASGKAMRVTAPSTTGRRAVSWNAADALANRDDVEVLFRWRRESGGSGTQLRVALRASGAAGSETAYVIGIDDVSGSGHRIIKYVNSTNAQLGTTAFSISALLHYTTRARVVGSFVYTRTWLSTDAEPEAWSITPVSDPSISAAGWIGLFLFDRNLVLYTVRDFAVATGGDTAVFSHDVTPVAISFTGTVPTLNGAESAAFSESVASYFSGSETPFAYSVQAGTLPAGLTLNTSTGVISGTPTTAGTSSGIVIRATDATPNVADTNAFDIVIAAVASDPVSFAGTVPAQSWVEDAAITPLDLSAYFAGDLTPFSYAVTTGTLPAGLSLNTSTGVISGTPTTPAAAVSIVVTATDTGTNTAVTNAFDVTITAAVVVVKGVRVTTSAISVTGLTAMWWDSNPPTGNPVFSAGAASTDGAGVLELNLDATTALAVGALGTLALYKLDATDHRDSLGSIAQLPIMDIA